jgi:methionyl-tRNA synthetase
MEESTQDTSTIVTDEVIEKKPEYLTIEEFAKLEARIGVVLTAEAVEGSEKLIRFTLDFGEGSPRQILSGIRKWYEPETLIGKRMLFVVNLAPRTMMGLESQGMLMAVDGIDGEPVFLVPEKEVHPGSRVH